MSLAVVHEALVMACLPAGGLVVRVRLRGSDGCAGCALVGSCGSKQGKGEEIELRASWAGAGGQPSPGERVLVSAEAGSTSRAATMLMTLPLAGLVAGTFAATASGAGDGCAAACSLLGAVAGFVPAIILSRGREKKVRWKATERIESIIDADI